MKRWDNLPEYMKNQQVRQYYDILKKKRVLLVIKRIFDIVLSLILMILLLLPMAVISIAAKLTSSGPIIFRQIRVTTGGKRFKILKFRTMTVEQSDAHTQVTVKDDDRITSCGAFLRKYRLDELPQLFNVLLGQMSFVGVRPEVPRYVERYTPEMYATLLLPAGITSTASIEFKDESEQLSQIADADESYVNDILPKKMKLNLEYIKNFSLLCDLKIMLKTVKNVAFD